MVEIDETRPTGAEIKPAWQSAFQGGIKLWFKYNGDFNRKYRKEDPFDSNSVVELMVNKKGTEETAAILVSLRNISPSMEDLAGTCQKELALQYPESVKMVPMWLHYDTDPIEVYHLMPIKEKDILILGVGDRTEWEDISQKLRQWLHYVDEFNGKMIAKMTADVSNLEDLVAFVQYLEPTGGMDSFVTLMETLLISESPTAEQAMFESWAKSGVSPQVLYPKTYLGLAHWGRFASGATESELPEYFCVMLKQFLLYVDMYREHGYVFGDKAVIGLLLERRDPQTLQDRLEYFGTIPLP
uniref:RxLR effector candidate protein n=1 Tax=Hyaloperonospora arabidopsidis (strain Emoy2) TaxID=559515 RepID=M4B466_HYAAE